VGAGGRSTLGYVEEWSGISAPVTVLTVSGAEVKALLEGEMIFTFRVHKQLHEVSFFVGPVLDRHHKPNFNQDVFLQSGLTTTCSSSRATAW